MPTERALIEAQQNGEIDEWIPLELPPEIVEGVIKFFVENDDKGFKRQEIKKEFGSVDAGLAVNAAHRYGFIDKKSGHYLANEYTEDAVADIEDYLEFLEDDE